MKITEDAVAEKVKAILFCENVKKVMSCHEQDSVHAPASSKKNATEISLGINLIIIHVFVVKPSHPSVAH